jgi:hypothetical protein
MPEDQSASTCPSFTRHTVRRHDDSSRYFPKSGTKSFLTASTSSGDNVMMCLKMRSKM